MVIDGDKVITGRFNFTAAAQSHNAENLLVIEDIALAVLYDRPATAQEAQLLDALVHCKLPPRNADVRFVLEMRCATQDGRAIMTAGRRAYLWRIAYRYRLQLPPELSRIAEERQAAIWHLDAT
jgi:phosphatidylserine/phosphatidylglycerophosphate/cardiolipin synthase-like enzyme